MLVGQVISVSPPVHKAVGVFYERRGGGHRVVMELALKGAAHKLSNWYIYICVELNKS